MTINRLLSRTGFILIVTLLIVIGISLTQYRATHKLGTQAGNISSLVIELQEEIGYGGLIHNFKNALIRPDEPEYIELSKRNALNALEIINQLEALETSNGKSHPLQNTREMVKAYQAHLGTLLNPSDNTGDIRRIDALVRVDDTPALEEISTLHKQLRSDIRDDIIRAEQLSLLLLMTLMIVAVAAIFIVANNELLKQRRRDQDLLERANSKLKDSNEKLERSNLALQQFAGIASHDLKAPARQVGMVADWILSEKENHEFINECAQTIKTVSHNMRNLIDALLRFTQEGFSSPAHEHTDMTTLVNNVVKSLQNSTQTDATIRVNPLPEACVDPVLMMRVWDNLISNSLKYIPPGVSAAITIDGETNEDHVIYSITDQGIGIEAQFASKIFDPLSRLHHGQTQYAGQGIGLSLVKAIIESHAGTVVLDTHYDGGARFVITLPGKPETRTG